MKFGAHISAAGGVFNAPINANKLGCETYQFFSRSPRGGAAPEMTSEIVAKFQENNKKFGFENFYIHAPYYTNLASANPRIYNGTVEVLRQELERGSLLGVKGLMFHMGSSKDLSNRKEAIPKVVAGLKEILKGYDGSCQLLIENSAGSGQVIGDSLEEIAEIIKKTEKGNNKNSLGVCFDTCHGFASGYDVRDKKSVKKTFGDFDKLIGLDRLKVIHLNDSKTELNSKKDRHADLGDGLIGKEGFLAMTDFPKFKKMDFILETPGGEERVQKDLKWLRKSIVKK
jgi:deoxyribonuclease IV